MRPDDTEPAGPDRAADCGCWCGEQATALAWSGPFTRTQKVEHVEILRCLACGTLRTGTLLGVPAPSGDGPGGIFVNREPRDWERINARRIARLHKAGPILEVGANTGTLLQLLREKGFAPLQGLEPNDLCVQAARRTGLDVVHGWFVEKDTPSGPFALIVMSHVLEHMPAPLAALALSRTRLAPGGSLLLFLPNVASSRARADLGRWGPLNPTDHRWHFTPGTIRKLLERQAGFGAVRVVTTRLRRDRLNSPRRVLDAVRNRLAVLFGAGEQIMVHAVAR